MLFELFLLVIIEAVLCLFDITILQFSVLVDMKMIYGIRFFCV